MRSGTLVPLLEHSAESGYEDRPVDYRLLAAGHEFAARSEHGRGSVFEIIVPRARAPGDPAVVVRE